jgi:hypothetical protein
MVYNSVRLYAMLALHRCKPLRPKESLMHELTARTPAGNAAPAGDRTSWTILVLLCVAQFMVILDVTVIRT